ncbi:hypothetical protein C8Q76DRAFT_619895, partial [Earliella scabrosa]
MNDSLEQNEAPCPSEHNASFPPLPINDKLLHVTIDGFSKEIEIENFLESGCAVCGLITTKSLLTPLDKVEFDRRL